MLTPAYLRDAAEPVVEIFSQVESDITADIARRIVKAGYVTETAKYQIEKMQEIGLLQGDVQKILAEATGKSEKEIQKLMKDAGVEALKFDDSIYRKAGLKPPAIESSPVVKAVLLHGMDKTNALVSNFTKTTATTSTKAFSSVLDRCYLQILSGAYDRNTALKIAINDLASKGIEKVAYPSGVTSSTEAAVRRAVTTGLNQSVAKVQLARAEEMGCELVETTSHAGARPTHAEWQGRVFCIKGHHPKYGDFYRETGYGETDGLCGINCYHSFFPYFEGLSIKGFSEDPAKEFLGKDNDEMYKEQMKQRYYERQIRAAKKECTVFSAAFDATRDPELKAAMQQSLLSSSDKLRRREAALNSFLAETGRTKDPSRVVIGGWSRNDMTTSKSKIEREAKEQIIPNLKKEFDQIKNRYTEEAAAKKMELVQQAGKEFGKKVDDELRKIDRSFAKKLEELDRKIDRVGMWTTEGERLMDERGDLIDKMYAQKRDVVKKVLANVRKVGVDESVMTDHIKAKVGKTKAETERNKELCKIVRSAMNDYPRSMIQAAVQGNIEVLSADRGYYKDGKVAISGAGLSAKKTAYHELAHRISKSVPHIEDLEARFYEMRTKGEKPVKLKDVDPNGKYRDNEYTKVDHWFRPYIGKVYPDAFELISIGFDRAMTGNMEIMKDREFAEFIFGILSIC